MLTKVHTIPAHTVCYTVPAHTVCYSVPAKSVIEDTAYEFTDLDKDIQEEIAQRMVYERLDIDMESEREFYEMEDFPNSDLKVVYDAGCVQGSGVNIYGYFTMNDLLAYAGLQTLDKDDFRVTFMPDRHDTCSMWSSRSYHDTIIESIDSHYFWWIYGDCTDKRYREIFWQVWEKRVEAIMEAMSSLNKTLEDYMYHLVFGGYADPEWHEDILYNENGTFLCYTWEWE